jgi:hypothetical protein
VTSDGWKNLVLDAVGKYDDGDWSQLDLLAQVLTEMDAAKQALHDKGYGVTGLSLLETVRQEVPAR